MTRVPPSRPPAAPARIIKAKKPQQIEKPVKLKAGNAGGGDEAEAGATESAGKPNEAAAAPHEHAKLAAELWGPESHAEKAEEKKDKEEIAKENERAEGGGGGDAKNKSFLKQIKPALHSPPQQKKPVKDGFEQQKLGGQPQAAQAKAAELQKLKAQAPVTAAAQVQAPATTPAPPARPSRPPDAFSVLHAAQDPGIYFREEGHHGSAEQANPELEEAIEEAIRLLFGVRGILRVTGGFNQANEPAIIVVATQGFGEASMKAVPGKVHRFETILAVPYDMLPLKRERL